MSRKSLAAALVVVAALIGLASPAVADPGSYVCLMATHDRNNPGQPSLCVWVPVDAQP